MKKQYEENPFEDELIAKQWINSVEGEKEMVRDNESYPKLRKWFDSTSKGLLIDIGSGQGVCSDKINGYSQYIGVEPSSFLVDRAKELYFASNRNFIVGNAYDLPLENNSCDQAISLNVWFHLEDISQASKELCRVLKSGGKFWIHTANSESLEAWKDFYINPKIENNKMIGEVKVPVNNLSNNIFYLHTNQDIQKAFEESGLVVDSVNKVWKIDNKDEMFVIFEGHKK
ncbi:MAG: hypothetical protein QG614_305 [Patescibacteria group bacterium]|nr:hypothetical protein [Patescibacteria group bacterium]